MLLSALTPGCIPGSTNSSLKSTVCGPPAERSRNSHATSSPAPTCIRFVEEYSTPKSLRWPCARIMAPRDAARIICIGRSPHCGSGATSSSASSCARQRREVSGRLSDARGFLNCHRVRGAECLRTCSSAVQCARIATANASPTALPPPPARPPPVSEPVSSEALSALEKTLGIETQ